MPSRVPDTRAHYEIALANGFERNMLADHRAIDVGEQYTPNYSITTLIADYIAEQDLEFRHALKTNEILRRNAVDEIFKFAKDSQEYQPIWEARVKGEETGDFYESEKLVKHLRAKIEQELMNADRATIHIFDTDDPTPEMIAMLEEDLDEASSVLDAEMYARQKKRAKEFEEGLSEVELRGREHGEKFFAQWLTDPAFVLGEIKKIRKHFEDKVENAEGETMDEGYVRGVEFAFQKLKAEHEGRESARLAEQRAKEANNPNASQQGADGTTLDDVIQANAQSSKEEKDARTAASAEKIKAEKEKKDVSSSQTAYSRPTFAASGTKTTSSGSNTNNQNRSDAGFLNYDTMPDGDEFADEEVEPELTIDTAPEDMIYRAQRPAPEKPKGKINKMKQVRKDNPKLGKNMGNGMQYGIGLGRNLILPDPEEVEVKRVNFKKRPWRWVKTQVSAMYRRHRKSANIIMKLTAFVALQLGVSTMTGRFEFKEDRHFVQMVAMTMFGFLLTSSLAKDGVPVGNAAFIL